MPSVRKDPLNVTPDGRVHLELPTGDDLPELPWFDFVLRDIRNDVAKKTGTDPEDVRLIGVRVYYRFAESRTATGGRVSIGMRTKYDPDYQELLDVLP